MKPRLAVILLAVALAARPAPVQGDSALDRTYGTPELGLSARSRAMGGTGAAYANGAFSLVDNPAALALRRGSSLQVSGGLARASENRFVPLFDTFDSFVDEAAIAVNNHTYGSFGGGWVYDPGVRSGVIVAAGIFTRYDPRYDYADERRTTATTDQIVSERFIRTRGMLNAASVGAALPLFSRATLGAALNWYYGTITDRDALVPHVSTVSGRVTGLERELTGISGTLGGTFRVGDRLQTGLAFETGPLLHDDFAQTSGDSLVTPPPSSRDLHLPFRVQGGATYRPRNTFRTTFAMDVIYMPWSEIDDQLRPGQQLLDTWDVRFGLEHVYYNTLPGRIGFRYARSPVQREADRTTFTFGVGYLVERFRLDVSGEVGKRISRQDPVWPRAEQGPAVGAGRDRVEDTLLRVFVGAEVGF